MRLHLVAEVAERSLDAFVSADPTGRQGDAETQIDVATSDVRVDPRVEDRDEQRGNKPPMNVRCTPLKPTPRMSLAASASQARVRSGSYCEM